MEYLRDLSSNKVESITEVPQEYVKYVKPFTTPLFNEGPFGATIVQELASENVSIVYFHFFIREGITLYPYDPNDVFALHFMIRGSLPATLHGYGPLQIVENRYNMMFMPNIKHHAFFDAGEYISINVNFSPAFLQKLAPQYPILYKLLDMAEKRTAGLLFPEYLHTDHFSYAIINRIISAPMLEEVKLIYLESWIKALLLHCLDNFSRITRNAANKGSADLPLYERIRAYVVEHPGASHTRELLAKRFALSESSLKQGFKRHFGITLKDFIIQVKMEKAMQLLYESNLSVTTIAYQLGYNELPNFTRAFIRFHGKPPLYYRRHKNTSGE